MKIHELIESDEISSPDLWRTSKNVEETMKQYREGFISSEMALEKLEALDQDIKSVIYDNDSYWENMYKKLSGNVTSLAEDWVTMENTIEKYRKEIKNNISPSSRSSSLHEQHKRVK